MVKLQIKTNRTPFGLYCPDLAADGISLQWFKKVFINIHIYIYLTFLIRTVVGLSQGRCTGLGNQCNCLGPQSGSSPTHPKNSLLDSFIATATSNPLKFRHCKGKTPKWSPCYTGVLVILFPENMNILLKTKHLFDYWSTCTVTCLLRV